MELAEVTQLAQSRVSNHLKLLREEGLVQERREGAWRHYRVEAGELPPHARPLWDAVRGTFNGDDRWLADEARLQDVLARREARGDFFDIIAGQWDEIREELFGDGIARQLLRAFLPPTTVVADIGTGTGYIPELLGDRPRRIIAIDNSEAMLDVARRKVASLGLDNVEFREGDAHKPPLENAEADLITTIMVLHHVERPAEVIAAAGRALRPGASLLVVDFLEHDQQWLRERLAHRWLGFAHEEVTGWAAEAGLQVSEWSVLPGRMWITPEKHRVRVPDGFLAILRSRQEDRK
jgi:ubiquinone/menaquinone biosynthesis C-methylase UbiE